MSIFSNIFKATDLSPSKNIQEFDCFEDFFDNKYYPFSKATKRRSHLELYVCSINTSGQFLDKKPWQELPAKISIFG